MDLQKRHQERSDDKETQYIPAQSVVGSRSTDKYDTQQLSGEEIRRRAAQQQRQNPPQSRPQPNANGYPAQNGAYRPQSGAPAQGGYQGNGYGYPQGQPQNRPYPNPNAYPKPNGYPAQNGGYRPQSGAPAQGGYQGNGYGYPQGQPQNRPYPNPNAYPGGNGAQRQRNDSLHYGGNGNGGGVRPKLQRPQNPQSQPPAGSRPQQKKRRSSSTPLWQKVLKLALTLVVIVFLIYSAIALVGIFQMNIVPTADRMRTPDAIASEQVENILVIGTDSRDPETDAGRSDSMILVSLNKKTNTVYMTSFLRDVYVYISDEYGYGKLNAAYAYGGAEQLMDTIESNYRIRIDDYVLISFGACAAMIDAVGGVEVTLSDEEAHALDEILISEVNELMGDGRNDDLIGSGGTYTLSGKQALSYSRIRYVGNADFERASRQRSVFSQVMEKAAKNPAAICSILLRALPQVSTNLSGLSMYAYAVKAPFLLISYDIEQQQIPVDNSFYGDTINGEAVLVTDFTENYLVLLDTVFEKVD